MKENIYLELSSQKQHQTISYLKQKAGLTWTELAKKLNISRSMVFHYNKGKHRISLLNFIKLCELANVSPASFKELKLVVINNKCNKARIPKANESLAEFLGILSGDGCLTSNYEITITCNAISDRLYVERGKTKICGTFWGNAQNQERKLQPNSL